MRSKKYWADRATALEYWLQQEAGKSVKEINDLYYRAIIDIEEEIEKIRKELLTMGDLTEDEWNELLRKADRDVSYNRLKELLEKTDDPDTMGDILNRMNAQAYGARITRLDELSNKVIEAVLDATAAERAIAEKCLSRVLREAFYTNIDNIAEGYNVGINFGIMPSRAVAAALQTPWNNMTYSERIWKNGREFASKVEQTVTTGLLKGASIQKMAAELKDCTEKGNYVRERLVRTETAHFMAVGQLEAYKEAGIGRYRFLASLSERTCDVCADLDGKTFNVDEATEGVNCNPIHPNCRCITITAEVNLSDRLAKDPLTGENYHTGKDMTFKEWKESFTPEQKKAFEVNVRKYRNKASDKKQYERYINRLGAENLPKSLDDWQNLKYTNIGLWDNYKNVYTNATGYIMGGTNYDKQIIVVKHTNPRGIPNSVSQYIGAKGGIDRNFYGEDGRQYLQVCNTDHGNAKRHPYGVNGEHRHNYTWNKNGGFKRDTRELNDIDIKENGDIL